MVRPGRRHIAGRRSGRLRRDRSRRPGRLGGCLPRGKGPVLRRPEPDGQPQRRSGRGNGCERRNRVPQRRIPGRLREDGEGRPLPAGGGGPQMARTQQQRREETVARLLEASIATIIEVGYARASAAVITKRAGVSVGALFRHFDTMGDFMAATAYEVLRRQLDSFTKQIAAIPADRPAMEAGLTILRDITSSSTNAVLYELMIAARTDEKLNATLQNVLEQYTSKICDAARALPGADSLSQETFPVLVALLTNTFDGAAMLRAVLPQPDIEERRIALLSSLLSGIGLPG